MSYQEKLSRIDIARVLKERADSCLYRWIGEYGSYTHPTLDVFKRNQYALRSLIPLTIFKLADDPINVDIVFRTRTPGFNLHPAEKRASFFILEHKGIEQKDKMHTKYIGEKSHFLPTAELILASSLVHSDEKNLLVSEYEDRTEVGDKRYSGLAEDFYKNLTKIAKEIGFKSIIDGVCPDITKELGWEKSSAVFGTNNGEILTPEVQKFLNDEATNYGNYNIMVKRLT